MAQETKFCKFCGSKIDTNCVFCTQCGKQVEKLKSDNNNTPQVVVDKNNQPNDYIAPNLKKCDKWVSLILCILLGFVGGHKFYEGKIVLGLIYFFTCGLFGVGVFIDIITILSKPDPYYI